MAKQMPCAGMIVAVLMPTTRPAPDTSGPPELPGFSGASVWITLSRFRPDRVRSVRPSATDDARRDGALEAERIADRRHQLAHLQRPRPAEFGVRQAVAGQPQHRRVGVRILADQRRVQHLPVGERGAQPRRAGDHVRVGQRIAVGREDHPGPLPARPAIGAECDDMHDRGADPLERIHDLRGIRIEFVGGGGQWHRAACKPPWGAPDGGGPAGSTWPCGRGAHRSSGRCRGWAQEAVCRAARRHRR